MGARERENELNAADSLGRSIRPEVAFVNDGCFIGHWQSILVVVWTKPANLETLHQLDEVLSLMTQTRLRFSCANLALGARHLPSVEVREAVQAILPRYASAIACSAVYFHARGFLASVIMAFLTGLNVVRDRDMCIKGFSAIDEMAHWIAKTHRAQTGESVEPDELRQVLTRMASQAAGL